MTAGPLLVRLRWTSLATALAGIALCAAWVWGSADIAAFWRAYLTAFLTWHTIPLGCLAVLLVYHVAGGPWGRMLGEPLEAAARTLPLVALLALPLIVDLDALFPWARAEYLAHSKVVRHKVPFLNPPFFVLRSLLYLSVWISLAFLLTASGTPLAQRPRRQRVAAVSAILFAVTASFAAIDWAMSIEPAYNSSTFGLIAIGNQLNAGLAFASLITLALADVRGRRDILQQAPVVGLGGLLLGAILLWIYLVFMEYLVVWSGDLPHNAKWFEARLSGGWAAVAVAVLVAHFVLPVLVLLSSRLRHEWRIIVGVATLVLLGQLLHVVWQTAPGWEPEAPHPILLIGTTLAIGGLWLLAFAVMLARRPRPLADAEAIHG